MNYFLFILLIVWTNQPQWSCVGTVLPPSWEGIQVVNKRKKDRGPLMLKHVPTDEKESLPDRRQVERMKAFIVDCSFTVDWEIKTQRAISVNRILANDARFLAVFQREWVSESFDQSNFKRAWNTRSYDIIICNCQYIMSYVN